MQIEAGTKKNLKTWSIDNSRSLYWARKNGLYCKWFVSRSVFLSSQQEQEKIHKTTCKSFLRAQNLNVLDSRIACFFHERFNAQNVHMTFQVDLVVQVQFNKNKIYSF